MGRNFSDALRERPLFFEPVPPSARAALNRASAHIDELVRLLSTVPRLDAIDVPELVDENHEGRPYYRSANPPGFARAVGERVGCEVVVNKVVAHLPDVVALEKWAEETIHQGVRNLVLVGGSSRYIPYPGPSVAEANRICRPLVERAGGRIGNIAIPQRTGEAHRMLAKTRSGASFFTTQILFDGEAALRMVRDYDRLCAQAGLTPAAVLLSLAPLADEGDAEFIRWLGADIPEEAERTILSSDESAATSRSVRHALKVWEHVTSGVHNEGLTVPLGVNIEQITARHVESAAVLLRTVAQQLELAPSGVQPR